MIKMLSTIVMVLMMIDSRGPSTLLALGIEAEIRCHVRGPDMGKETGYVKRDRRKQIYENDLHFPELLFQYASSMYTSLVNPKSATLATLPSPTWVEIEIIIGTKYIQQAFIIAFHNIMFHVSLHLPRHFWLLDLCERASYQQDRPYPLQPAEIWIDLWANI